MKLQLLTAILTLTLGFTAANSDASAQSNKNPTFAQYAAQKIKAKPAPVNLKSNPQANDYRTRLKEAASGGINFAGGFIIASWGCGTGCGMGAVIDARTGAVYFPEELGGYVAAWGDWTGDKETLEFKPSSRLLIIRGKPGGFDDYEGIFYFEWTGRAFKKLKSVEVKPKEE